MQSKATEGFFRHHSPQFTLQLPPGFHRTLQTSTASLVIPAGRGIQHFTTADLGASRASATLTLPSGIAYPIHVPAGVTLQTASGQIYKVNMPVMVTQAPGGASILQHPIQQIFQQLGQSSVLQANIASVAQLNTSSVQAAAEKVQTQDIPLQQTTVLQQGTVERKQLENSANATLEQQPPQSQQQVTANTMLNQQASSMEKSPNSDLHTAVFTSKSSEADSTTELVADNTFPIPQDMEGQVSPVCQDSVQQQVSDDIIELIIMGNGLDDNPLLKDQDNISSIEEMEPTMQIDSEIQTEQVCSGLEGIIQLDGTGDVSPKEEIESPRDVEENEFIGIIDSEDLKVLDDDEEDGDSISNSESSSSSDTEEPPVDIIEEDPLNSGDDVSEQDTPDLFDTDNVIVCQYDKIHRSKNKWKFYLKDGIMCFGGKDYVFAKAIGDAEW
ncbi:TFIIA-alpha and beta-like factor [Alligator sinensis]|uniref:TFIIA-alpha and beta-like factor n=1 Tax=Alligator sinensis TaxID=38654 RepID=A0A3Q0GJJ1_ALLSI|nr:TFIIA-alpha and beta-like factor [Alligator sinensis]